MDRPTTLVAVEMGYGHLRAAAPLAAELGTEILECDRPPLAAPDEAARWRRTRSGYEALSRAAAAPLFGGPLRRLLEQITDIPGLYPIRDQSAPTAGAKMLARMARGGLGRPMIEKVAREDGVLLTTFYAPAVIAREAGLKRIVCVVSDSDVNRVWAPVDAAAGGIHYCAPGQGARRRLRAFGVPDEWIHVTGFPLPPSLTGGDDLDALRRNLAARIVRLDPRGAFREEARGELAHFLGPLPKAEEGRPPLLVFAVGGAGAQAALARQFLPALRGAIFTGRLRLALVAGTRPEIADGFRRELRAAKLEDAPPGSIEILLERDFASYYAAFNALLARADVLWTKPSELSFYAALGLPLVFAPALGVHERANRRFVRIRGAGFKQEQPRCAWDWLRHWLEEGILAGAAWAGYTRMPKFGARNVADVVRSVE